MRRIAFLLSAAALALMPTLLATGGAAQPSTHKVPPPGPGDTGDTTDLGIGDVLAQYDFNNTCEEAREIAEAGVANKTISAIDTDDWYKFTTSASLTSNEMKLTVSTDSGQSEVYVYTDCYGELVAESVTRHTIVIDPWHVEQIVIPSGLNKELTWDPEPNTTYYIYVNYVEGDTITYSLVLDDGELMYISPGWFHDDIAQIDPDILAGWLAHMDDTCAEAVEISGSFVSGLIVSDSDTTDYRKFTIGAGYDPLRVTMDGDQGNTTMVIYDSCSGSTLDSCFDPGCDKEVQVDHPPAGTYYLKIQHISGPATTYSLTISGTPNPCASDSTPPDTTVVCPLATLPSTTTDLTINIGGSDNCTAPADLVFRYSFYRDGNLVSGWTNTPSAAHLIGLVPGWYDFFASSVDGAANTDMAPAYCGFLISNNADPCASDLTPPDTLVTGCPPSPAGGATSVTVNNVTGTDNCTAPTNLKFQWKTEKDGALIQNWTPPAGLAGPSFDVTGLSVGNWVISIRAMDEDGNVDPSPHLCPPISIADPCAADTLAPNTVITNCPGAPLAHSTPSYVFSLSGTDNCTPVGQLMYTWCMYKGGAIVQGWTPAVGASFTATLTGTGSYKAYAYAEDLSGNTDSYPFECLFSVL